MGWYQRRVHGGLQGMGKRLETFQATLLVHQRLGLRATLRSWRHPSLWRRVPRSQHLPRVCQHRPVPRALGRKQGEECNFGCNRRERDERDEGDVEVDVEEGEQAYACDQSHVSSEVDIEEGE